MSADTERQQSNEGVDFAYLPFKSALEVATAIYEKCGGVVKSIKTLEEAVGIKGGALRERVFNARKYGLIEGRGTLILTELAMEIIKPTSPEEKDVAIVKSILSVSLFKKIAQRYTEGLPSDNMFFKNTLEREYDIKKKIVGRVLNAIKKNFELLSEIGLPSDLGLIEGVHDETSTKTRATGKLIRKGNILVMVLGENKHEFEITIPTDWKIAKVVLNGFEEKWLESKKKENSAYLEKQEDTTEP